MSSTPSKSLYENLALETVQVGGTKVSLPALPPTGASDTELALYLNSLISQLESVESRTTASDRLLALGNRTALSIYPQSTITSVRDKIDAELFNPANFTILSFHTVDGASVADATLLANAQVLRPVGDNQNPLVNANRRPQNITSVRVAYSVDLADLIDPDFHQAGTIVTSQFHILLPQDTLQVMNGANQLQDFTGYTGPADISALTPEQLRADITSRTGQTAPARLVAPTTPGVTDADVDTTTLLGELYEAGYLTSWATVCKSVREAFCPGVAFRPQDNLRTIKQVITDANGNTITLSVEAYSKNIMASMLSYSGVKNLPSNYVQHFLDNLAQPILQKLKSDYTIPQFSLSRVSQLEELRKWIGLAVKAANDVALTQSLCKDQALTLMTSVLTPNSPKQPSGVFASNAEQTLRNALNTPGKGWTKGNKLTVEECKEFGGVNGWKPDLCFACSEPHRKENCPFKDNPAYQENITQNIGALKRIKSYHRTARNKKRGSSVMAETYLASNPRKKQELVTALLADPCARKSIEARLSNSSAAQKPSSSNVPCFVISVVHHSVPHPQANCNVDSKLPHIQLPLGRESEDSGKSVRIAAVVDTGAAINVAHFDTLNQICRRYPWVLKNIYTNASVKLSGIIKEDDSGECTTELPYVFELWLPFNVTLDNGLTYSDGCSVKVPAGRHVTVNMILGMPFLKPLRCGINFADNCLDTPAFQSIDNLPIEYRQASVNVPPSLPNERNLTDAHANYARVFDALDAIALSAGVDSTSVGLHLTRLPFGAPQAPKQFLQSRWTPPGILRSNPQTAAATDSHGSHQLVAASARTVTNADDVLADALSRQRDALTTPTGPPAVNTNPSVGLLSSALSAFPSRAVLDSPLVTFAANLVDNTSESG